MQNIHWQYENMRTKTPPESDASEVITDGATGLVDGDNFSVED